MAGTSQCYSSIKGLAMRATRLDSCGHPVTGASGSVVSCGFTKLDFKAELEDGTEFLVKTAGGVLCVNQKDAPSLKRLTATMDFCSVDPQLYELTTGVRLINDGTGNSIGYALDDLPRTSAFALEVWTQVAGAGCGGFSYEWLYTLLPWVVNGIPTDFAVENAPVDFKMVANTRSGSPWALGPYAGLIPAGASIGIHDHYAQFLTAVAPPACACGYAA